MKNSLLIALTIATVIAVAPMLAGSSKPTPIYPGSVFVGFGENKDGAKKISVAGDVANAGEYFLPGDATLYDLLMRIGPCSGQAEFSPPSKVVLTMRGADGKIVRESHRLFLAPPDELKRVPLVSGMICYVPHRIL